MELMWRLSRLAWPQAKTKAEVFVARPECWYEKRRPSQQHNGDSRHAKVA